MKKNDRKNIKKMIVLLLIVIVIVILFLIFCKKGETPSVPDENVTEILPSDVDIKILPSDVNDLTFSENCWDYDFAVAGEKMKLPCDLKQITEIANFEVDPTEVKNEFPTGEFETTPLFKNGNIVALATLMNDSENNVGYKETKLCGIYQCQYPEAMSEENLIIFPGGVYIGKKMTYDEMVSVYGEPTMVYSAREIWEEQLKEYGEEEAGEMPEDYRKYTFHQNDYDLPDYIEIYFTGDVITEVGMRNIFPDLDNENFPDDIHFRFTD